MAASYKKSSRRIGVEIEYNSADMINRSRGENDLPVGIYEIANHVKNAIKKTVDVTKWQYTHNNHNWAVKPDSSCGLEVCSPPLITRAALREINSVVNYLSSQKNTSADYRCSLHVHVEIADFTESQIVLLLKKWISAELFFYLLVNPTRWINQYCMPIGFSCEFDTEQNYFYSNLLLKLSESKYYSANLYHYGKNKKKTIEFRLMGNEACLSSDDAENWCKILVCFVDRVSKFAGADRVNLNYDSFENILDLLSPETFFDDNSVILWMIEKISNAIDNVDFEVYNQSKFFWQNLLTSKREEIQELIARLESYLK